MTMREAIIDPRNCSSWLISGTNMLHVRSAYIGAVIPDSGNRGRTWTVSDFFYPDNQAPHLGIRLRCMDMQGTVAFINQRDAQVLMDASMIGQPIPWAPGDQFVSPLSSVFRGFHTIARDRNDDLYLRECAVRLHAPSKGQGYIIPRGTTLNRRILDEYGSPINETWVCIADADETGYGPDTKREQVARRWSMTQGTPA